MKNDTTFKELKKSGYTDKTINQDIQTNLIAKIKANFSTIILVFILLVGLSFLLYPTVSDYWNSFHQSEAIAGYVDKVNNLTQQENDRMLSGSVHKD